MVSWWPGLIVIAAALLVSLQTRPPASAPTGSVRGVVALEDTHKPAAGANVFLIPLRDTPQRTPTDYVLPTNEPGPPARGQFRASADASGAVSIPGVAPGRYLVAVQVPGYIQPEDYMESVRKGGSRVPAYVQVVNVRPGEQASFHVPLQRGGVLDGEARLQSSGAPAAQVHVSLLVEGLDDDPALGYQHTLAGLGSTDETGHVHFEGLRPGRYVMMGVLGGEWVEVARGRVMTSGPVYFSPGVFRLNQAEPVVLRGTETVRDSLRVPAIAALHSVTGHVIGPDGAPLREGVIRLEHAVDDGNYSQQSTYVRTDGSFAFHDVPDDSFFVTMPADPPSWAPDGFTPDRSGLKMRYIAPRYREARVPVTVAGQDPAPVTVTLASP